MISVVIPSYNAAGFIVETLDSIRNQQDIEALEIIVVDDGSKDNTRDVVQGLNDERISFLQQRNAGPSAARNKGLSQAKGEFVVFFDHDDIMSPDFLCKRREVLLLNESLGFSCGPLVTFPDEPRKHFIGIAEDVAKILLTYEQEYSSCPSNYLIRKSVLLESGLCFNEELGSTADRFFLIELATKTRGKLIEEAPLHYRVSANSMSKLTKNLVLDNEKYFFALRSRDLIPKFVEKEFFFKIKYILGLAFLRTGLYNKGLKYTTEAFIANPGKFIRQII